MKELIFPGRAVLVGDAAADAVVDYSAVLTRMASADTIELRALDENGHGIEAYYLLGGAAAVMAQTVESALAEPDNDEAVRYMRAAIRRLDPDLVDAVYDDADAMHFRGHRPRVRENALAAEASADPLGAEASASPSRTGRAAGYAAFERQPDALRFGRTR
jgi:hypothetical protein